MTMRLLSTLAIAIPLIMLGCDRATQPNPGDSSSHTTKISNEPEVADADEHGHQEGKHGGTMVSLGRDSYHVEAVFDSEGKIRLYMLGKDESRVIDVEKQSLKGFVKLEGESNAQMIVFEPSSQDGDVVDRTSLFVGELPQGFIGKSVDVTIPNIVIDGERFRLGFKSEVASHNESGEMPDKISDQAERELYLVASGRYTTSDIEANGNVSASEKFRGIKSTHDMSPKSGDKICPITQTKANPKFNWIVDGKSYLFCCPPCIDEFVKEAKESNEPLAAPDTYVKQ